MRTRQNRLASVSEHQCGDCANAQQDSKWIGCEKCKGWIHAKCAKIPEDIFEFLVNSENFKFFCNSCKGEPITDGKEPAIDVAALKKEIMETIEKTMKSASYKEKLQTTPQTALPKPLVKPLTKQCLVSESQLTAERLKRSRIVLKPMDNEIRTSVAIRREFNKTFKGIIIKHCRVTSGGSILSEFEDEQAAQAVENGWTQELFGGNKGMKTPGEINTCGVVKHLYEDLTEEEIVTGIQDSFPNAQCELFRRKTDNKFIEMVKADFKSRQSLQKAIDSKLSMYNQRYIVEEYKRKTRAIKCANCQEYGHVHRYCIKEVRCGKCDDKHDTRSCTVTEFKCHHCKGNHKAGTIDCPVYIEKMEKFSYQQNAW